MKANPNNTSEQRECHRCRMVFPLLPTYFLRDKTRPAGLSYECKACHRERRKGRDRRKERWSKLTPEQRAKRLERQRRYGRTPKGRAIFLMKAYQQIDRKRGRVCDIDKEFMLGVFAKPCVYCGTTEQIGCDRIDNARGHTRDNIVSACADCNIMRGDRFTHSEMLQIGRAVALVKAARDKPREKAQSEAHP